MYQAIMPTSGALHRGYKYDKYPTDFKEAQGAFFKYEIIDGEINIGENPVIDNMDAETRTLRIRTAFNLGWHSNQYIASEGKMYKIDTVREVCNNKSVSLAPRSYFEIALYTCQNPLAL